MHKCALPTKSSYTLLLVHTEQLIIGTFSRTFTGNTREATLGTTVGHRFALSILSPHVSLIKTLGTGPWEQNGSLQTSSFLSCYFPQTSQCTNASVIVGRYSKNHDDTAISPSDKYAEVLKSHLWLCTFRTTFKTPTRHISIPCYISATLIRTTSQTPPQFPYIAANFTFYSNLIISLSTSSWLITAIVGGLIKGHSYWGDIH